jgi:hypothetical protein
MALRCKLLGHTPTGGPVVGANGVWLWKCWRCQCVYRPALHIVQKLVRAAPNTSEGNHG